MIQVQLVNIEQLRIMDFKAKKHMDPIEHKHDNLHKGFYTWISSPKTLYNKNILDNVAIIAPTPHYS